MQKSSEQEVGLVTNGGPSRKRKADEVDADSSDENVDLAIPNGGRKRKADEDLDLTDGGDGEGRKKTKGPPGQSPPLRAMRGFVPAFTDDAQTTLESENLPTLDAPSAGPDVATTNAPPSAIPTDLQSEPALPPINESEWAAFEADIAPFTNPQSSLKLNPHATITTTGVITAAPLSASELSAQRAAAEEAERKRNRGISREEEAEAEKEEEGRRMEEEFEVQEEMEARVRRLRERREMLRRPVAIAERAAGAEERAGGGDGQAGDPDGARVVAEAEVDAQAEEAVGPPKDINGASVSAEHADKDDEEEQEDDIDIDEFDEWGLR